MHGYRPRCMCSTCSLERGFLRDLKKRAKIRSELEKDMKVLLKLFKQLSLSERTQLSLSLYKALSEANLY